MEHLNEPGQAHDEEDLHKQQHLLPALCCDPGAIRTRGPGATTGHHGGTAIRVGGGGAAGSRRHHHCWALLAGLNGVLFPGCVELEVGDLETQLVDMVNVVIGQNLGE